MFDRFSRLKKTLDYFNNIIHPIVHENPQDAMIEKMG